MRRGALGCLLLTLWFSETVRAQDPPSKSGIAAFAEGKQLIDGGKDARFTFRRAMHAFRVPDPDLMRTAWAQDLGNAAFLADDLPRAILTFRYGLSQDRHHAVLRQNLQYARSQVQYAAANQRCRPEPTDWPRWLPRLRLIEFLSISAVTYCVGCLALTCFFFKRRPWMVVASGSSFALAATAAYGCFMLAQQWQLDIEQPPAIIRHDDVALHIGNGLSYPRHPELPTLARGMEARRVNVRGDWWQVQFASGEIGWISAPDALSWEDLRR